MKGVLKKQGKISLGFWDWRERYFKQDDDKIYYYKAQADSKPQGFIDLKQVTAVKPTPDNFGFSNQFGFEVHVPGRVFKLVANSEAEMLAWINTIAKLTNLKVKYVSDADEWQTQVKAALRGCIVTFKNSTPHTLQRLHHKLHGPGQTWKKFPPEAIPPGESVAFGTCSTTLLTGTRASVTFTCKGFESTGEIWLRWENPYRKLTVRKQALFEASPPFLVVAQADTTQSHTLIYIGHDLYQIQYTLTVDETKPAFPPAAASAAAAIAGAAEVDDKKSKQPKYHEDWVAKLKLAQRSSLIQIINDSQHTLERAEWDLQRGIWRCIPQEKIAPRSVSTFGTESNGPRGTYGKVVYMTATKGAKDSDTIFSFNWANSLIHGVSFAGLLTCTGSLSHLEVVIENEKKEFGAEVVFRIREQDSAAEAVAPALPPLSPFGQLDSEEPEMQTPSMRRILVQEPGETKDRSPEFQAKRRASQQGIRSTIERTGARFEVVCHEILSYVKRHQDLASSFLNLFKDAEEIPLSINLENPDNAKAKEKVNCQMCGLVVYEKVISYVPFLRQFQQEVKPLKNLPAGVRTCAKCLDSLNQANDRLEWKSAKEQANNHPLLVCHKRLLKSTTEVTQAMQDFNHLLAIQSMDALGVARRVEVLLKDVDEVREDVAKLAGTGSQGEILLIARILDLLEGFLEENWLEFTQQKKSLVVGTDDIGKVK